MTPTSPKPAWPRALALLSALLFSLAAVPAMAQRDPCPWTNDGECDEPGGTGLCAPGTDRADCASGSGAAGAGEGGVFPAPTIDGREIGQSGPYRVDWCLRYGSACGQPAADAFCRRSGFDRAADWQTTGHSPTVVLQGQRRLCSGAHCTALANLRCIGRSAPPQPPAPPAPPGGGDPGTDRTDLIPIPRINDLPIDICLNWQRNCGQPSADRICQALGRGTALSYDTRPAPATWVQGDQRQCTPAANNGQACLAIVDLVCSDARPDGTGGGASGGCQPDPGTMATLNNMEERVGQILCFDVTGAAHVLYGVLLGGAEGVYSFNSTLAMAAVQAGVLGNGQSGQVRVEILPGPGLFRGTTRYGVTSGDSDQSGIGHLAFRFVEAR